ncbi:MAG: YbhB/YbcL family Raf kinase inhibitor-like protein [Chloroflexi bacterium]|nr:YbhB/YbcL family Raf kinase inhibitor-like protein [Chloroflexota bacterium]
MQPFTIHSKDFQPNTSIPIRHTCSGVDESPALTWNEPPPGTESFTLICDDPDAPRAEPWVHWVIFRIPANVRGLPQNVAKHEELPDGSRQGKNDFGKVGYGGPCPPVGHGPHRYFFRLYALDTLPDLAAGCTKAELLAAIDDHILAETQLVGTFERA